MRRGGARICFRAFVRQRKGLLRHFFSARPARREWDFSMEKAVGFGKVVGFRKLFGRTAVRMGWGAPEYGE